MTRHDEAAITARIDGLSTERRELLLKYVNRTTPKGVEPPVVRARGTELPSTQVVHGQPQKMAQRTLKHSLFFFAAGEVPATGYQNVIEAAKIADAIGLHAVWLPERHFDKFGAPYPDPAVLASALIAVTKRVQFRSGSVVLPLQDPIRVAEQWSMLDIMSGGRVGISFASGWHPDDFVLAPERFEQRKVELPDRIREFQALWRGTPITRTNGTGLEIDVVSQPRPASPDIPVWITTSSSEETWRVAGRMGLNVLTGLLEQTVDELAQKIAIYEQELESAGFEREDRTVTLMLHSFVGPTMEFVRSTVQGPLTHYLRQHIDLYEKRARSEDLGIAPEQVSEQDKQVLVQFAFERYFRSNGFFGTVESLADRCAELKGIGVDEVGHLIDYGVPEDIVFEHLPLLAQL